ncbi:hypothetical protein HW555_000908 [Spodoptera exigua]|uniref:Uncharacterized protein n=1 Tax=Spodoptera exigua TaxID=7107 RepID=A0A835L9B8_SPOEX|nr:hypothetical protein HW555_000908 [Spodoptera exigua]
MKLLCFFVLVVLCAALCDAQPVDNLTIDYPEAPHIRIKRQNIIKRDGRCRCPKDYTFVFVQCISCKRYLELTGDEQCPVCS